MTRFKECEAPAHEDNCECQKCRRTDCGGCRASTVDHFTGKKIAEAMGWTKDEIERPENTQRLSRTCHIQKDKDTGEVVEDLKEQKEGKFIGFGEHHLIGIFNRGKR